MGSLPEYGINPILFSCLFHALKASPAFPAFMITNGKTACVTHNILTAAVRASYGNKPNSVFQIIIKGTALGFFRRPNNTVAIEPIRFSLKPFTH